MVITTKQFAANFRTLIGDTSQNVSDEFIISALNQAFSTIATVPRLARAFSKHYTVDLKAKDGCKWKLEGKFRRLADIPLINFFSTGQGGDPCPLNICPVPTVPFYKKHGIPSLKQAGIPCEYTIEQEDDNTYLVLDRPSDVPLVIDYIAYGYPAPVTGMTEVVVDKNGAPQTVDTTIEISSVIETCILSAMKDAFYQEAEDMAFAGAMVDLLTNKYIPEAIQMLYHQFGAEAPRIIGES